MNQSKIVTDGALLIAVYIVMLLITMFVPLVSLVAPFVLPVPFIIFASRHDWKPSFLLLAVALILTVFFATIFTLPVTVLSGIGGIMIGSAIHRKLSPYETWARGTLGFVMGLLFAFAFTQFVFQVNLVTELNQMFDETADTTIGLMEQFNMADLAEEELEVIEQQMEMLTTLLPVMIAFLAIMMAFVSQWIGYKALNRLERKKLAFPPFRSFRLPISLVWIYFFTVIFMFFDLDQSGTLYMAVNNVQMLAGMLMALQGFSFIFYYAHLKNKSKALPIMSVILTLLFPVLLLYLVRLLGIIDIGFSLRDRLSEGKK
ncbi:YybS family protein [Virgibacillus kekensis]|uniref:YybS family protein n=1 Tax=Virgibacillus kekensis TaxID=202261 RepID=A0ABV9DJ98_9BACI